MVVGLLYIWSIFVWAKLCIVYKMLSLQSIVRPLQSSHLDSSSPTHSPDVSSSMSRHSPLGEELEDPSTVNTAIFYSIISTQKGTH